MAGFKKRKNEIIAAANITPLINVMLVLLTVFMLVSSFTDRVKRKKLDVSLPKAATGQKEKFQMVTITIPEDGTYYFNDDKISKITELVQKVTQAKKETDDLTVVINADKMVYHERIVKIITILQKNNITKFAINVEKER